MLRISISLKILILILLSSMLYTRCAFEYNEKNFARYKEYQSKTRNYVAPKHSSCKNYEKNPPIDQWELIWSDEFNYEGHPDENKWDYDYIDPNGGG